MRAKQPIVRFQDVDEIDIAVDVPETLMVADIQSADIVQMTAELSGAPGRAVPGAHPRDRAAGGPDHADLSHARRDEGAARRHRAARHDGHGERSPTGAPASSASRSSCPISAVLKDAGGRGRGVGDRQGPGRRAPPGASSAPRPASQIEIVDGLQPGDRIAVAGVRFLRDGMTVRDLGDALGAGQS